LEKVRDIEAAAAERREHQPATRKRERGCKKKVCFGMFLVATKSLVIADLMGVVAAKLP
jgi:hypothetical protein